MTNKGLIVTSNAHESQLRLEELCNICHLSYEDIEEFIAYEIISPHQTTKEEWVIDLVQLRRIKRALRLQRELEMSLASVSVVLDLLEEVESLRRQMALFERHYLK